MRCSILIFILAGCSQAPLGVDSYLETQRAATEELCSCASSLDMTVSSCFDEFDVIGSDHAASECARQASEAADATDAFACQTRAASTLESCARRSRCRETTLEFCLDAWRTDLSRCPRLEDPFDEVFFVCNVHTISDEAIVDSFFNHPMLDRSWAVCAEPILRPNPSFVRPTLECMLIALEDASRCDEGGAPDCQARLNAQLAACPALHADIATALTRCE